VAGQSSRVDRAAVMASLATLCACSHDWDAFDPRAPSSTSASSAAGPGGAGPGTGSGGGATGTGNGGAGAGAASAGGSGGAGGPILWAKRFGGAGMQRGHRVAAGATGDVYVAGTFEGSIDLGAGTLASQGATDVFVAKLDGSGATLWSVAFGNALAQETFGLTVRSDGNVVVSGSFEGAVDFGDGVLTSAGDSDGFVVALDPASGAHICSSRVGGPGYDVVSDVAAEDDGDTDIIGMFGATATLGEIALVGAGQRDIFYARLTGCEPFIGAGFGGTGDDYGWSIAAVPDGVVMGMDSNGTMDFGGGPLTSAGMDDVFLARIGHDGGHVWSYSAGDAETQWAPRLAATADGFVAAGSFMGTLGTDPDVLTSAGSMDVYVARVGGDGVPVWGLRFGDEGWQSPESVAVDARGRVLLTGSTSGVIDLGGGPLPWGGAEDLWMAVLDGDGDHLWSFAAGDEAYQSGMGIAADPTGGFFVTGLFEGTLDLGAGPLVSAGDTDVFVAKVAP
jgi:hypothetical protein